GTGAMLAQLRDHFHRTGRQQLAVAGVEARQDGGRHQATPLATPTPYSFCADSALTIPSSTSSSTFAQSRWRGSPYPPPQGLTVRMTSPGWARIDCSLEGSAISLPSRIRYAPPVLPGK